MSLQSHFLPTGVGYVFKVGDDHDPDLLVIEVTNLRTRAGSSYALLTTSTVLPGARTIPGTNRVLNAEVWLLSSRSREEYAASLARLIPTPAGATAINYGALLEELSQRVIEQENAPVDVIRLQEPKGRAATQYLIEGLIPAKKATIMYGAGGTGKSVLASTMAVCIQTGTPFLGLAVQQAEVLYLDWETDEEDISHRVAASAAGLGLSTPNLRYSSLVRPIEDRVAPLARFVAEEHIGCVIIDSVGMAMSAARDGGDPSEVAIRFFRALRSLDAAVLAIDHISGDDMRRRGSSKPYGSVYKWNSARNAYELRTRKEPDAQGIHLLLKHRKTNVGPLQYDLPLRLNWGNGLVKWERETLAAPVIMPVPTQILDVLSTGPATPNQIADMLSDADTVYAEIDVRRELKVMLGAGTVQAMSNGTIRLAQREKDALESGLLAD